MTIAYPPSRARRLFTLALPVFACTLLASCAGLIGPREVEIPLSKLQAGVDRRFPVSNRMLDLFDVQLSRPQVSLPEGADRVAIALDASIAPPFVKQSWTGSMSLSGRLFVDVARGAVFMGEPKVDRFNIDGVDEARQRQFTKVANVLMEKVVRDVPVYNFKMEDLRYAGVQFVPTRIRTRPDALLILLEPAR
ncbi:MAG: DUF1439 domain-containing protein [Massilia sp.]